MSTYPNLNNDPARLILKKVGDIKNLKNQTEKHDHEKKLKSLIIDNEG